MERQAERRNEWRGKMGADERKEERGESNEERRSEQNDLLRIV